MLARRRAWGLAGCGSCLLLLNTVTFAAAPVLLAKSPATGSSSVIKAVVVYISILVAFAFAMGTSDPATPASRGRSASPSLQRVRPWMCLLTSLFPRTHLPWVRSTPTRW